MNYVLQVVRGRSASTTLKLADGVTSIGRHDDCLIRIKSSQVSRRHCEFFEVSDKLTLRDLGSSNGTFVNGKKVSGQQALKHGDELTVGAVTLRVAKLGQARVAAASRARIPSPRPPTPPSSRRSSPTKTKQEEFEMEFDDGDPEPDVEGIPSPTKKLAKPAKAKSSPSAAASRTPAPRRRASRPRPSRPKGQGGRRDRPVPSRPQTRRRRMIRNQRHVTRSTEFGLREVLPRHVRSIAERTAADSESSRLSCNFPERAAVRICRIDRFFHAKS